MLASCAKAGHGYILARMAESQLMSHEIETFFDRLAAALPEPKTELAYTNPFTLLVAVVLSAWLHSRSHGRFAAYVP